MREAIPAGPQDQVRIGHGRAAPCNFAGATHYPPHPDREDSQCDAQNADDAALAEAIIAMARTLGLTVPTEQLFETLYRNAKIS